MSEFKRGDRVKVLQPYGDNPPFNTEGIVLSYSGTTYLIEFNGWFAGHTAMNEARNRIYSIGE